jgi:tRNA(Ile)-lysidine synthetase-like protein
MKIIKPIPHDLYLACSGGIDSMFGYHFLTSGRKNVHCLFFNHGTKTSEEAELFLKNRIQHLTIGRLTRQIEKGESPEKFFREQRYAFFSKFQDRPIITCHHLNDCAENWIMTSLKGTPKLIPYKNGNIIRPFLMIRKKEIEDYCLRKNVEYSQDLTNYDVNIPRNRIRNNVMNELIQVNPGFFRMIKTKINQSIFVNQIPV